MLLLLLQEQAEYAVRHEGEAAQTLAGSTPLNSRRLRMSTR